MTPKMLIDAAILGISSVALTFAFRACFIPHIGPTAFEMTVLLICVLTVLVTISYMHV